MPNVNTKRTRTVVATAGQFVEIARSPADKSSWIRGTILNVSGDTADYELHIVPAANLPADIVANPPNATTTRLDKSVGAPADASITLGAEVPVILDPGDVLFITSTGAGIEVTTFAVRETFK